MAFMHMLYVMACVCISWLRVLWQYYPYVTLGRKHFSMWEFLPSAISAERGGISELKETKVILVSHTDRSMRVPEFYNGVCHCLPGWAGRPCPCWLGWLDSTVCAWHI